MKKILCLIATVTIASSSCSVLKTLESSSPSIQSEGKTTEAPSAQMAEATQKLPSEADSGATHKRLEYSWHTLACNIRENPTDEISLKALKKQAASAKLQAMLISNCEIDHLRAFIALNKSPIVIVKHEGAGVFTFMSVTGYEDESKQITLRNFLWVTKGRGNVIFKMEYSKFEALWKESVVPHRALILSPRSAKATQQIEQRLSEYLPKEKLANLIFH
jgi:hypothetical protein